MPSPHRGKHSRGGAGASVLKEIKKRQSVIYPRAGRINFQLDQDSKLKKEVEKLIKDLKKLIHENSDTIQDIVDAPAKEYNERKKEMARLVNENSWLNKWLDAWNKRLPA